MPQDQPGPGYVKGKDGKYYGPGESYEDGDGNVQFVPGGDWKPTPSSGDQFGADMRSSAFQNPNIVNVNHADIARARGTASDSYGKQQQALGMLRASAMGQGPSVARQAGQAGQDQALMAMLKGGHGGPMLPGQGAGLYQAGNQAAQQRGQEIGQAQQGWAGGANAMRGQSLQDLSQGMNAAYGAQSNYMNQQQQNIERQQRLQQLSQGGYNMENAYRNEQANINAGFYADELQRQQQQTAAAMNMFGSAGAGLASSYGSYKDDTKNGFDPYSGINRDNPY